MQMSLFYLGVLPHVPRMLPVLISDPVMRQKVEDTFTSQEFLDNLEGYFVDNIKVSFFHIPVHKGKRKFEKTLIFAFEANSATIHSILAHSVIAVRYAMTYYLTAFE